VKAAAKTSPNPKSKSAVKAKGPSQGKPAAKSAAKPTKPVKTPPAKKAVAQSATKASVKQPAQTTVKKAAAKAPIKASAKKAAPEVKPNPKSKPKAKAATAPATPSKPAKTPAPAIVEVVEEVAPEVVETPVAAYRQSLPPLPAGPVANGAIYYDSHMHTPLCKHAWGEPEEYAAQGVQAGLKGIIFTCHCPMPDGFWPTVRMADSEFDTYLAMVDRTAKAFKGKLDVRLGLESEYFPGMEGWIEKLHQRADFDYILGAVHWQARDYLAKFETGTIEAFRKSYFNHLAVSAETGLYDCLAHPDLVKNYHPDSWCLAIVKGSIATALDRIAATGVAMELNTSGLNKSYSEMNPGMEMLRMMADRNIPIVVSSDAHRAQRVGEHFMTALSHLQEAGYDQVSYFLKRQRIDLKISEVQASIKKAADSQVA
jgi:histidinol-phosphatase (PHP family)